MRKIYVSADKRQQDDYRSVMDALNSIPEDYHEPITIYIAPGVYHEKITIDRAYITLEGTGERREDTILTFDDYANDIMEDGMKRGTFRSYSVFIDAHDVTLKNLTIENASGDSLTHGQAIALYADGDRIVVDSCRLLGHQDTLFTGPLPPKEIEKTVLSDRNNSHRVSMGDNIIRNVISVVILTLFLEVRPLILRIVR